MARIHIENLLLRTKLTRVRIIILALVLPFFYSGQIVNYVKNGGFEEFWYCGFPNDLRVVKHWRSIDSSQVSALYYSGCSGLQNTPANGQTYQPARNGTSYIGLIMFCLNGSCNSNNNRSYARTRLKQTLQSGATYCVKFNVNVTNTSSYGVDGVGAYFGDDNSLDTISKVNIPLTYLNPQVQNPNGNVIMDTMNWVTITGTFVASGTEKNLVIGNFKSTASTNSVVTNPNWLPIIESDFVFDDVSCIPLDLPAYAGPDLWAIPGSTVYIGRQQDVGIDEACMWYKLPNTTTAIDTAAGITLTVAATTETYMVKQDICGVIKYDTVVVHQSAVGLVTPSGVEGGVITVSPNPAQDLIELKITNEELKMNSCTVLIYNSVGQLLREEEIILKSNTGAINTSVLPNGVYLFSLQTVDNYLFNKRFIISR